MLLLPMPSLLLMHPCNLHATALALSADPLGTRASCEQAHRLPFSANPVLQSFDLVFFFTLPTSFALHVVVVGKACDC